MILLDTKVVSEPLRLSGDPAVTAWIDAQNIETLYLAAITLAELRFGVAAMASGRRKDTLERNLERRVVPLFAGRILPFDTAASQTYAEIMAWARSEGKAIGKADGYIAATAAANGLIVATRDTSPFEAARVTVINPWKMR